MAAVALLPWLSQIGYAMRSVEMVVVMLFGLTLIAGMFGLMFGVIGTDHIHSTPRASFGFLELLDGVHA